MTNLALPHIQEMAPYKPPLEGRTQYPGLRLDFNERTVPPAKAVIDVLRSFGNQPQTHLYPEYFGLEAEIASYAGVESDQVMVTNGTDQAIDVLLRTFSGRGDKVIIPRPAFSMYEQYARVNGNAISRPTYAGSELAFPDDEIVAALDEDARVLILANPNNPTGDLLSTDKIAELAEQSEDTIVFVDEAYFEFSQSTAAGLIETMPNVIVSRTFSKAFGLAALRIGYVLASQPHIDEMLKVRGPYDVNQLGGLAASAALGSLDDTRRYATEVMEPAKNLVEEFFDRSGVPFHPSAANFLLFKPRDALGAFQKLREEGVLVRPQTDPTISDSLRVTIATIPEMEAFIDTYQRAVLQGA